MRSAPCRGPSGSPWRRCCWARPWGKAPLGPCGRARGAVSQSRSSAFGACRCPSPKRPRSRKPSSGRPR
eukprot:723237-Prymnesium_polylepis.1